MKQILLLVLLVSAIGAKDRYPKIRPIPGFTGEALEQWKQEKADWDRAERLYKQIQEKTISHEDLNDETLNLLDSTVYSPFGPRESVYDITPKTNCDYSAWGSEKSASSTLPNTAKYTYDFANIRDYNLKTAWVEGEEGYGIGTKLYYTFENYNRKEGGNLSVEIYNGYVKSETSFKNNSRVKTLNLYGNGTLLETLHLQDTRDLQIFEIYLPGEVSGKEFYLEIADVYKGLKWADVCITELLIYRSGCCLGAGTKITMADGSEKAVESIVKGDLIKAGSESSEVLGTFSTEHENCYRVVTEKTELVITDDHPILSSGSWKVIGEHFPNFDRIEKGGKLAVGDMIDMPEGAEKVTKIEKLSGKRMTYTITKVSKGNSFFANGIPVAVESFEK